MSRGFKANIILCFFVVSIFVFAFLGDCKFGKKLASFEFEKHLTVVKSSQEKSGFMVLDVEKNKVSEEQKECEIFIFDAKKVSKSAIVDAFSAKFVKNEQIGEINVYYYFSSRLSKKIEMEGEVFNLQIAITDGKMIVAYPINLAGF